MSYKTSTRRLLARSRIPSELPDADRENWRRLPFEGADNCRDLGGYSTRDGRHLKWGLLYRSGHLGGLTKEDIAFLNRLKLKKVVDFRGVEERIRKPDRLPEGVDSVHHPIDVAGTDLEKRIVAAIRGEADLNAGEYLNDVNRRFATEYTDVYRAWILDMARNDEALPQVFHCTAGKDRAGFASAILLTLLGVPRETIITDYLKTNDYTADSADRIIRKIRRRSLFRTDGEIIRPLLRVEEAYIRTAFETIDRQWGSFEVYQFEGLGLKNDEVKALKERLLENTPV
ncbi:MAG: tyrosine-protein phosphatase [Spirochaetaceae bacterium]|nr:tyrosine-protein phosphatase [Spirochaetaceae bacterium]MDT8297178.1 tyrosine-protein phosphatase [Spirochaetaceae bacterium]